MKKIKIPKMAKGGIIENNSLIATMGENNNIDKDLLDFLNSLAKKEKIAKKIRCFLKKNRGIKNCKEVEKNDK